MCTLSDSQEFDGQNGLRESLVYNCRTNVAMTYNVCTYNVIMAIVKHLFSSYFIFTMALSEYGTLFLQLSSLQLSSFILQLYFSHHYLGAAVV